MKLKSPVTFVLGVALVAVGVLFYILSRHWSSFLPVAFGGSLITLGWAGGRVPVIIFGHTCIIAGCVLVVWGLYLLPHSQPTPAHIFGRPLFWGLFAIGGGVCANYHGFCKCIRRHPPESGSRE